MKMNYGGSFTWSFCDHISHLYSMAMPPKLVGVTGRVLHMARLACAGLFYIWL